MANLPSLVVNHVLVHDSFSTGRRVMPGFTTDPSQKNYGSRLNDLKPIEPKPGPRAGFR